MAFNPDKNGKYRVNFYLNPDNENDRVIIDFLNGRYSVNDYIKETIFSIATNNMILASQGSSNSQMNNLYRNEMERLTLTHIPPQGQEEPEEEYEEIKGMDDIEL